MKTAILGVLLYVAFATANPIKSNVYLDVYRNVLNNQVPRVYNGIDAELGQFKHQASIRWALLLMHSHICGGSLITKRTVLTAAHCKPYSIGTYDVVLGQLEEGDSSRKVFKIQDFIVHSEYPGGVAVNDIAIINLKNAVTFSSSISAIQVAVGDECDVSGNKELQVSGFGLTSKDSGISKHLKYDLLRGIDQEECARALTAHIGNSGPLDETMVCASSFRFSYQGVCSGDSGGPLTLNNILVGVTSWGITPCGTRGAPSVFTNVCAHTDFINLNKIE